MIDADGSRFLLGDDQEVLYVLQLHDKTKFTISDWKLEKLGEVALFCWSQE